MPAATLKPKRSFTPEVLKGTARTVAVAVQSMGCTFIIIGLSATMALYILFRSTGTESIIVFNQDLALLIAHIFVLTMREPSLMAGGLDPTVCKLVSILLHYFFLAGYTFMTLEAMQTMFICGNIIPGGHVLSTTQNIFLGWGIPLVIVGATAPIIGDEYSTYWTCWGDLENALSWGLFGPMAVICACGLIMCEAGGMMGRENAAFTNANTKQALSATISRGSLPIVMGLTIGSHVVGMAAVFFQQISLYGLTSIFNIANAIAVFVFHTSMDTTIREFVKKCFKKVFGICMKK